MTSKMTMTEQIKKNIQDNGLTLPEPAAPLAAYVPWRVSGDLLFISGQGPAGPDGLTAIGKVGADVSVADAVKAAELAMLNVFAHALVAAAQTKRDLRSCVKLGGFVNCNGDFAEHPKIINGASQLTSLLMGDAGAHARFAVGAPSLPFNMAVEVEAVFELA